MGAHTKPSRRQRHRAGGSPNNEASARGWNAGERGWDGTERGKRRRLYALQTRASACLSAQVHERDVWRARAHAGTKTIAGGQNGGDDQFTNREKGWTASELRAWCCRLRHLQKSIPARHEGRASQSG
jgi:hypothetical protein